MVVSVRRAIVFIGLAVSACAGAVRAEAAPGDTSVLKWKDGKKAVFLLAFDDSCQSHVHNAIPELRKRGLVGTFYINPGNGPFQNEKMVWEKELSADPAVVFGNHTFTHSGATNAVQLDIELAKCDELIRSCYPSRKQPWLVSFGRPGGKPWTVTKEEEKAGLEKYHLVERPPFFGYPFHVKTADAVCNLVDQTIKKGEVGHLDSHGVGGDWLVTPMPVFTALLDKLVACSNEVWVTDHITCHKYQTERGSAKAEVVQSGKASIRLRLTSQADARLYDTPLTLKTLVPAAWKTCRVVQGTARSERPVTDGFVCYEAVPGKDEIVIAPK